MLSVEQVRKALGEEFSHLSDAEVEQLGIEMHNFWAIMIED